MLTVAKFEKENYCVCVSANTGVLHHACRITFGISPLPLWVPMVLLGGSFYLLSCLSGSDFFKGKKNRWEKLV